VRHSCCRDCKACFVRNFSVVLDRAIDLLGKNERSLPLLSLSSKLERAWLHLGLLAWESTALSVTHDDSLQLVAVVARVEGRVFAANIHDGVIGNAHSIRIRRILFLIRPQNVLLRALGRRMEV
jgi:hypothetical protein